MHERDLWWKIVIVGALVALAFAAVWPVEEKLKFGIDLYGGYSLLYEIDDTGLQGEDKTQLSTKVMDVLRERVDPKGVFNLVWRPVGHNRLEIQMPRPSGSVRAARARKEALLEQLRATILRRSDALAAVAKPADQRSGAFAELAGPVSSRVGLFEAAAQAYDELEAMRAAYEKRVEELKGDTLTKEQIEAAVQKPEGERAAALEALVGAVPARKELLQAAARAWEDSRSAKLFTTQPVEGPLPKAEEEMEAEAQAAFEKAVQAVLDANVDPLKLAEGATIDEVVRLEDIFSEAVGKVLATNIDIGRLQVLEEMKPGEEKREEVLQEFKQDHQELTEQIDQLVQASDELNKTRKGEGRLEDPADLQRLLRGAGVLEFRILPQRDPTFDEYREALQKRGPRPKPGEDQYQWFEIEDVADFLNIDDPQRRRTLDLDFDTIKNGASVVVDRFGDKYYVLSHIGEEYAMTHVRGRTQKDWSLRSAFFDQDENGRPAIGFILDDVGGEKFRQLTRRNKGRLMAIFLDDQVISYATIESVIGTRGQIRGQFQRAEVLEMVKKLNAGSLPRKLKDPPISVRSIGPSLGQANREAGLRAALLGGLLVALFMTGYYFYAGAIAVFAVAMNTLFIGASTAMLGATLTLPGIAGLVLAIGMAVDANVLINERIREELTRGTAMRMAIKLGYQRAFSAILDSNLTTILTCVILYVVGSEEVKGFGLTLGVGVFINIFTAYFVTRMFFEVMTMISIPREIKRYPLYAAGGVVAAGALLYGLGYVLNDAAARADSVAMGFGKAIMEIGPVIAAVLLLMVLGRTIHRGRATLPMLRMIGILNFDWIGRRYAFFTFSALLTIGSLTAFASLEKDDVYDIEFLGGVNAQIDLKEAGALSKTEIEARLSDSADTLNRYADAVANAQVSGAEGLFALVTPGVPASRLDPALRDLLKEKLNQVNPVTYDDPASDRIVIQLNEESASEGLKADSLKADLAARLRRAAESVRGANVQATGDRGDSYSIVTRETAKELVVDAILETMENQIQIQPALAFTFERNQDLGGAAYFPISTADPKALGFSLTGPEAAGLDLREWHGGVAIVLDNVQPAQEIEALQKRLKEMRLQPGFEQYGWRQSAVFPLKPAASDPRRYERILVTVLDPNFPMEDEEGGISALWQKELAEPEVQLLQEALQRQTSLSQITQFDKQVSGEAQIKAYLALALSWLLIIIYVWIRFGNIRWGFSAVIALVHVTVIALGALALSYYLAGTAVGSALLVSENFRIDLPMVAAILTIIGYSVNDTIVVFDRIRENRGRFTDVTPEMINASINQTLPRTLLTGLTTMGSVLIMYVVGGRGIHGFCYVMLIGLIFGTYSSIGIASQFLLRRRQLAMSRA